MKLTKNEEHKGEYDSRGWMLDGWKSAPFFDGAEYAEAEFRKHITDSGRAALEASHE